MKLTEVLTEDLVKLGLEATTRDDAIRELVRLLAERGRIGGQDIEPLSEAMLRREHLGSTAIGRGVAVPHAKADCAARFMAAFGCSKAGIEFASVDGRPVHFVFLLASPPDSQRAHLKALAHISRLMTKQDLQARLMQAGNAAEVLRMIGDEET